MLQKYHMKLRKRLYAMTKESMRTFFMEDKKEAVSNTI